MIMLSSILGFGMRLQSRPDVWLWLVYKITMRTLILKSTYIVKVFISRASAIEDFRHPTSDHHRLLLDAFVEIDDVSE